MSSIQITSDLVKSAISEKLSTSYPIVDIYKEKVEEGLTYPSFFINQVSIEPIHIHRNKYIYEFMMNINYMVNPSSLTKYKDLDNVGCELIDVLEKITIGNIPIKGKLISVGKQDDVEILVITYSIPVTEEPINGIKMAILDSNEYIK